MHYVDAGRPDVPIILLLQDQPTWAYLYLPMIRCSPPVGSG